MGQELAYCERISLSMCNVRKNLVQSWRETRRRIAQPRWTTSMLIASKTNQTIKGYYRHGNRKDRDRAQGSQHQTLMMKGCALIC